MCDDQAVGALEDNIVGPVEDNIVNEKAEREIAKASMVYLKSEKSLNLGKMKATDYKYNQLYNPTGDCSSRLLVE